MSRQFDPDDDAHRRYNPLTGDWVLVSPHRSKRPWRGQSESTVEPSLPEYEPECYLCAGNKRINGELNPVYENTFVFQNDFAALTEHTPEYTDDDPLFRMEAEQGISRVICFSPRHDLSLPELSEEALLKVVNTWVEQSRDLAANYTWVQIFENKGAIMGCSMPHPHGQVWAQKHLPGIAAKELQNQGAYYARHGTSLLLDYQKREVEAEKRIVVMNDEWLVIVPFWASWPFETIVLPRTKISGFSELSVEQCRGMADIVKQICIRYDNLFQCSFPYSMGWHAAPNDGEAHPEWQLHAHFFPPLLRSAGVKKFMVGYELMAESQRDITPEQAAKALRNAASVHYKNKV